MSCVCISPLANVPVPQSNPHHATDFSVQVTQHTATPPCCVDGWSLLAPDVLKSSGAGRSRHTKADEQRQQRRVASACSERLHWPPLPLASHQHRSPGGSLDLRIVQRSRTPSQTFHRGRSRCRDLTCLSETCERHGFAAPKFAKAAPYCDTRTRSACPTEAASVMHAECRALYAV